MGKVEGLVRMTKKGPRTPALRMPGSASTKGRVTFEMDKVKKSHLKTSAKKMEEKAEKKKQGAKAKALEEKAKKDAKAEK